MGELLSAIDKGILEIENELDRMKNNIKIIVKQYKTINLFSEDIKKIFLNKK